MSGRLMRAEEILGLLGGERAVRDFLRGIEEGSETAREAQRSMLSAIEEMQGAGVPDRMARLSPNLYATACLLRCAQDTDCDYTQAEAVEMRINGIILKLRNDPRGYETDET